MRMIAQAQGGDRPTLVVRDSWLEEGDNTHSRYTWANRHTAWNFERNAEPWMQSSDYLALRNVEFNYTFPKSVVKKLGIGDLSAELLKTGARDLKPIQLLQVINQLQIPIQLKL